MIIEFILLGFYVMVAFYTDVRYKKIPNYLSVSGTVIGLLYFAITGGWKGLLFSGAGMLAGFLILLLLYLFGAVGAGDVKLFAGIGALSGLVFTWNSIMYSIIYAGVIGIIILMVKKDLLKSIKNIFYFLYNLLMTKKKKELVNMYKENETYRFPFMYAVLPGVLTAFIYYL